MHDTIQIIPLVKKDYEVFQRIRDLAYTECNNRIIVTQEVLDDIKEISKIRKKRGARSKKPFGWDKRVLCRKIIQNKNGEFIPESARRKSDGSCVVYYGYDFKNKLAPSWIDNDWFAHQVDRAFCLWSKFVDIDFKRDIPRNCVGKCFDRSTAVIKITWAKPAQQYHYIDESSPNYLFGYRWQTTGVKKSSSISINSRKSLQNIETGFEQGVLAHAYPPAWIEAEDPVFGDVHINADFDWVGKDQEMGKTRGFMLFHTLVHEIGHTLGLSHMAGNPRDIMYTTLTNEQKFSFENPYPAMARNGKLGPRVNSQFYGKYFYGLPDTTRANATEKFKECETILTTLDPNDLPNGFEVVYH